MLLVVYNHLEDYIMARRKWTDEDLKNAVETSISLRQAIIKLGLCGRGGGCFYFVKKHIARLGIDTSHFKGQSWLRGIRNDYSVKPLEHYLVTGKLVNASLVKRKLVESGIWENKCSECGQGSTWNGKQLVLQLDHKDGDRYNNKLENLRLLCPNCHTQTPTFTSRKMRKPKICKNNDWRKRPNISARKCEHPSKNELSHLINTMSWCAMGRKYGVSDNAVRKWAKKYGLI